VRLRAAGPTDLAAVRSLAARSFAHLGDYGTILADWFRARGVRTAVAESPPDLLGFVMWAEGRILAIAVAADARRQGVGRALLRHALEAHGDGPITLEVAADNGAAQALFQAEGFAARPGAGGRYPGGVPYETMVRTW
jgi:ribosomal protein S18 acetylase RimI-like enzyme